LTRERGWASILDQVEGNNIRVQNRFIQIDRNL
jgi:hypothetical protein